jgi:hypothetical protein
MGMPLDRDALHRAIDLIEEITKSRVLPMLKPGGDVLPTLFVLDDSGTILQVSGIGMTAEATARDASAQIERLLRARAPAGYIVQWMGWLSPHGYNAAQLAQGLRVRPSDMPDRIEVLNVTAGSSIATAYRLYIAKRDLQQRLRTLDERRAVRDMLTTGVFCDMLGSRSVH